MVRKSQKLARFTPPETAANHGPSRRNLLLSLFWTAALANAATLVGGHPARAQQKVSKELAQYQDSPKDGHNAPSAASSKTQCVQGR